MYILVTLPMVKQSVHPISSLPSPSVPVSSRGPSDAKGCQIAARTVHKKSPSYHQHQGLGPRTPTRLRAVQLACMIVPLIQPFLFANHTVVTRVLLPSVEPCAPSSWTPSLSLIAHAQGKEAIEQQTCRAAQRIVRPHVSTLGSRTTRR